MQLSFFAIDDDLMDIVVWLVEVERFRIFEGASVIDRPIREVRTGDDFAEVRKDKEGALLFRGWSISFTNAPEFRRIKLNPGVGDHRTVLEGVGIVQIEGGRFVDDNLYPARISHWNEAGARSAFGDVGDVDWTALKRASGRMTRKVKGGAAALANNMIVMPGAFALVESGAVKLWLWGVSIGKGAPELRRVERSPSK